MSASSVYLPSLQAFRAVAAMAVVFYHACLFVGRKSDMELAGGWFHFGELGVDFFFVLSGFIIAHVHGGELGMPGCAPRYLKRRFFRVYPLLFLLTTFKLLAELPQILNSAQSPSWEKILCSYLLLPSTNGEMPLITAAWTLQHEALFYALFLLGMILGRKTAAGIMFGWIALILAGCFLDAGLNGMPRLLCDAHNVEFVFGVLASESLQQRLRLPPRILVACFMIFGLITGFVNYDPKLGMDQSLTVRGTLGLGFASLIWLMADHERRIGHLRWPRAALWLGDASYSIYLAHSMVLMLVVGVFSRFLKGDGYEAYGLALAAALAGIGAGACLWTWIERPMLRWSRNFGS